LLDKRQRFPEKVAKKILKQIILGFKHLYQHQVVHRDLKLDNLLIHFPNRDNLEPLDTSTIDLTTEKFEVKIADFGYSRELNRGEKSGSWYGSPLLMAPESLFSLGYDHKVDVWALGIIYFQLLTGYFCFAASDIKDLAKKQKKGEWAFPKAIEFTV
jgi:serine/threonine protein kinase